MLFTVNLKNISLDGEFLRAANLDLQVCSALMAIGIVRVLYRVALNKFVASEIRTSDLLHARRTSLTNCGTAAAFRKRRLKRNDIHFHNMPCPTI